MKCSLQDFQTTLDEQCYGKDFKKNKAEGLCIDCKEPAIPKCYSNAERKEFQISGLCEECFNKLMSGEER